MLLGKRDVNKWIKHGSTLDKRDNPLEMNQHDNDPQLIHNPNETTWSVDAHTCQKMCELANARQHELQTEIKRGYSLRNLRNDIHSPPTHSVITTEGTVGESHYANKLPKNFWDQAQGSRLKMPANRETMTKSLEHYRLTPESKEKEAKWSSKTQQSAEATQVMWLWHTPENAELHNALKGTGTQKHKNVRETKLATLSNPKQASQLEALRAIPNRTEIIKGHLVNQQLGGHGGDKYVACITSAANTRHKKMEAKLKRDIAELYKATYNGYLLEKCIGITVVVTTKASGYQEKNTVPNGTFTREIYNNSYVHPIPRQTADHVTMSVAIYGITVSTSNDGGTLAHLLREWIANTAGEHTLSYDDKIGNLHQNKRKKIKRRILQPK